MGKTDTIFLPDEAATEALGAKLAQQIQTGTVFLTGNLGAGKTSLTRGWLRSLGHQGAVKSPTYTLVEPYQLNGKTIYHFDLYRLIDPEELELIGGRDYFDEQALCLVEWPEQGQGFLPTPALVITLSSKDKGRQAKLEWNTTENAF